VEGHNKNFFGALRRRGAPLFVPAPLLTVFIDRRLNSVGLLFCDL